MHIIAIITIASVVIALSALAMAIWHSCKCEYHRHHHDRPPH